MVYPSQTTDRTKVDLSESLMPCLCPRRAFLWYLGSVATPSAPSFEIVWLCRKKSKIEEKKIKHSITASLVLPSCSPGICFLWFLFCITVEGWGRNQSWSTLEISNHSPHTRDPIWSTACSLGLPRTTYIYKLRQIKLVEHMKYDEELRELKSFNTEKRLRSESSFYLQLPKVGRKARENIEHLLLSSAQQDKR